MTKYIFVSLLSALFSLNSFSAPLSINIESSESNYLLIEDSIDPNTTSYISYEAINPTCFSLTSSPLGAPYPTKRTYFERIEPSSEFLNFDSKGQFSFCAYRTNRIMTYLNKDGVGQSRIIINHKEDAPITSTIYCSTKLPSSNLSCTLDKNSKSKFLGAVYINLDLRNKDITLKIEEL